VFFRPEAHGNRFFLEKIKIKTLSEGGAFTDATNADCNIDEPRGFINRSFKDLVDNIQAPGIMIFDKVKSDLDSFLGSLSRWCLHCASSWFPQHCRPESVRQLAT